MVRGFGALPLPELTPLLRQAVQTIAAMRGRAAAEAFAARFGVG